ncbi:class I adenylate-forming enzyme family protein [Rhizorhabdus dicambivorans]|uniref:AMP-dependent synthetase n=1 Tax=Rhizorhabdus dicambivorans TaxID=1850238 RepID=A0A2A4FYC5_9SPHN|nr:class I adenylate-forming enzyme family protein [Rhizorhabdus dicambivorans]ATE64223.1 AMP-dependent synthetase [Rhizorhabdus dicambivorans]PCE42504.1 AMP-dependent synthetase [Rhizorhabdus dicambivorans]
MTANAAEQMRASLDAILDIAPEQEAVEFRRQWWTWGTLRARKQAIEEAISQAGLGPDIRVGVILRNRPEVIPAVLAAVATGRCLVTLNPTLPDAALRADISKLKLPVIVASSVDWARSEVREAGLESGALCIELSEEVGGCVQLLQRLSPDRLDDFNSLAPGIAVEMLTSGTTGAPKRIPLRRSRFAQSILGAAKFEAGRSKDDSPRLRPSTQLLLTPFAHIGGLLALLNALLAGRKTCVLEKFEVSEFQDAVKRHRPKVVQTPPAGLAMVLAARIPKEDLSSLVAYRTGAAPLDPALADEFWQTYGIPVLQNYGATELGGVAGWTLDDFKAYWPEKRGAVGRLNPGVEARITAVGGEVLATGEEGILELKGSQIGDPDSWTATTDLAVLDKDGFLWIKGRADATIIRGGFKIQPHSVAEAIERHPAIREAAVVGIADRRLGQVPAAAYALKPGTTPPSVADLRKFLREMLLPYQIPAEFIRVDELPRTASMKVGLQAVRELFEHRQTEEG